MFAQSSVATRQKQRASLLTTGATALFIVTALLLPAFASAAQPPQREFPFQPGSPSFLQCSQWDPQKNQGGLEACIAEITSILLRILLALALMGAVIFFVLGGLTYIFCGADETTKRKTASLYLTYSLLGIVVALVSYTIVVALRLYLEKLTPTSR